MQQLRSPRGGERPNRSKLLCERLATRLSNVNVTVTDLTGPGTIAKSNISLYREQYVSVSPGSPNWGGSNQPLGAGVYPDPLIPFTDPSTGKPITGAALEAVPFNVAASNNQSIWVDVFVPRNAAPGQYTGNYTVSSNQGNFTGSISLTVWHFTLPQKPSLESSFSYWTATGLAADSELLRNRLTPLAVPASEQASLMSNYGLTTSNLGFWSGADVGNCTMSAAPSVSTLQSAVKSNQSGLKLFNFTADEIGSCSNLYSSIQQWARNLHQAGVDNLVTMAPVSQLMDDGSGTGRSAVDIWTMLPIMYNQAPAMVTTALQKGDQAWSANTLVQDAYSPKWEIDFDPINFRIQPGFINQSLGLSGVLYWRIDRWSSDPWNQVNTTGQFSSNNYPGEGILVYPGTQVGVSGVVASMRMKWLRDGADDYDYITLLKQQGWGDWALQLSRSIASDWTNWTRDHNLLESIRTQMGEKLDTLAGGTTASAPAAPSNPSPASGATAALTPTLSWTASSGATSYSVYFGTTSNPASVGTTTGTSFSPGTLTGGTTYYWKVAATNTTGSTASPVWSFVTQIPAPGTPQTVSPANGSTVSSLAQTLSWSSAAYATSYDVYFGTTSSPGLLGTTTGVSYGPGTLVSNTTYYWKVVAKDSAGSTSSAISSFTTPPPPLGVPANPSPASGATAVTVTSTLSWSAASGATSYDVYFGTSSTPALAGTVTATSYSPGTLSAGSSYFWRVVAKNGTSTSSSPTWSFTTAASTPTSSVPAVLSVTPQKGSGMNSNFVLSFSDGSGYQEIAGVNLLINSTLQGTGGCWLYIQPGSKTVYLANDSGASWSSAVAGSSAVLQNSQCSLAASKLSVTGAGTQLTVSVPLTFTSAFAGQKTTYTRVADQAGSTTSYQTEGTWTVQ